MDPHSWDTGFRRVICATWPTFSEPTLLALVQKANSLIETADTFEKYTEANSTVDSEQLTNKQVCCVYARIAYATDGK